MSEQENKECRKCDILQLAKSSLYYTTCLCLLLIIICNLSIIVKSILFHGSPPSLFGRSMLVNMSSNIIGIEKGDLLFFEYEEPENLKADDVVALMNGDSIFLGRISVSKEEGTERVLASTDKVTEEKNDYLVTASNLVGTYKRGISKIGNFIMWSQSTTGIVVLVVIPLIYSFIHEKNIKKKHETYMKLLNKDDN